MCGIIGYIGKKDAFPILISGLKRMEYRGYDSYGFCVLKDKETPFLYKKTGKISEAQEALLDFKVKGFSGIGHSRWATHGGVTDVNAHPHFDCHKNIFVVHNGIIENYKELKKKLIEEGHIFVSQTDTEVLPHLIEKYFEGNLEEAVRKALKEVRGTYGILVVSSADPNKIIAARFSSPLILGLGKDEFLVASDPAALITHTRQIIHLEDNELAILKPDKFFILKEKAPTFITWDSEEAEKKGYAHFMLKEIMESPETIQNATRGRLIIEDGSVKLGGLDSVSKQLKQIKRLVLVACGTANYAARIGKYMIEEYAGIPVEVDVASEFRYRRPILDKTTAAVFVSQSGETADTLASMREMKKKGLLTIGITNVVGSSQARETDAGVYTRSGPEIAVASTKAFLGQLSTLAMLTVYLGRQREMDVVKGKEIVSELLRLPSLAEKTLERAPEIEKLAEKYKDFKNFWFMGRKYHFPIALEGALKLKEISYIHAEGSAGGELKHGPLALIDENIPVVALCPDSPIYDKMISNLEEVVARNGKLIIVATEGDKQIKELTEDVIYIPKTLDLLTPILSTIPLHLFAYYIAVLLGRDVDKPRNLAKSVTVE